MDDTTPEVDARFRERLRRRTPTERAQMGFEMFDFARDCGRMGIRRAHPDLTDVEVEQRLFLRMYGDELSPAMIERALARIAERFQNGNGPGSRPISTRPTAS